MVTSWRGFQVPSLCLAGDPRRHCMLLQPEGNTEEEEKRRDVTIKLLAEEITVFPVNWAELLIHFTDNSTMLKVNTPKHCRSDCTANLEWVTSEVKGHGLLVCVWGKGTATSNSKFKKTNVKGRITFNMCSYVPVETEQTVCQGTTDEAERLVKLGFHHEAPRCPF